jgi:hypothetical protein
VHVDSACSHFLYRSIREIACIPVHFGASENLQIAITCLLPKSWQQTCQLQNNGFAWMINIVPIKIGA